MAQRFRRSGELQRDLKALNQKEDRDLQHKLNMLDRQHRYTCKMLQQRRDSLMKEQRRVVMVKVVEPKATVNIAMKEIGEHADAEMHLRGIQMSGSRRSYSRYSQHHSEGCELRTTSAPVQPSGAVRRRGNIQSSLSLMQMKNIATIDSISEKELARRQQEAQEEMERLRRFQRETLHRRVAAFIEQLRDKNDT